MKKGIRLTAKEKAKLRTAYDDGCNSTEAAAEIGCTRRTANVYFAKFRGGPGKPGPRPNIKKEPVRQIPSRFYSSTFEL